MNNSLTRPLAVVTGASNGIGYELAKQFAQNGFDLLITATGSTINDATQAFEKLGAKVETVEADLATDDPALVAKQGFEALMAGKDAVIAGSIKTKLQGNVSKVLPDTVKAEQHRQLTEPGSARK